MVVEDGELLVCFRMLHERLEEEKILENRIRSPDVEEGWMESPEKLLAMHWYRDKILSIVVRVL